jgi:hypothetical protein
MRVSKRYCLLPQGFSEACATDCEHRHRHLSSREVRELVAAGEIELHDVHPIRLTARFIERVHDTQKVNISANVIRAAAGVYKTHRGESKWARRKISEWGKENRAFSNLFSVVLPGVFWTEDGLTCNMKESTGTPVCVVFKPAVPEARAAAVDYCEMILERNAKQPILRSMAKGELRRERGALSRLDAAWPHIVARFSAGPFSEYLSQTNAGELPSMLLTKTLREYLR